MTTSPISTLTLQNGLRHSTNKVQAELDKAKREVTTGTHDDYGTALGAEMSRVVDLTSELDRIKNNKDTNSIINQRLESSQVALGQVSTQAQSILSSLIALSGNVDANSINTATTTIKSAFQDITSKANTTVNGEFLFSGINTDVKPMDDYFAAGSPAKAAFDTALNTFLAAQAPPLASVSGMSGAQMTDFIDNTLTPMFTGTDYTTNWSSATDQNMTNRVVSNQIIETSTNTNSSGFRQLALGMVISVELLGQNLSSDARAAAAAAATNAIGVGKTGIDQQRTTLGLAQQKVSDANTFLDAQRTILEKYLSNLESVDPYEASTLVELLKTQLQASYTLTAHLQSLSLVNFL